MSSRETIQATLRKHLPDLKQRYPIAWLALFGSYTRGEQTAKSDIDILVDFNGPVGIEFVELADELEKILHSKVDLVSKGGLKPRHWDYLKERLAYV